MVEGHLREMMKGRRMSKRIEELEGHHIVVGMGRVGSVVCESLAEHGRPFVVVDRDEARMAEATERGWLHVTGDATDEQTLQEAGVARAKTLIAALDTDADNVFVSLTARGLKPDLFIVARSSSVASEGKLVRGGADRVITPDAIGGRRMANMAVNPIVSDYLDVVTRRGDVEFELEALPLPAASPCVGGTLADLRVHETTGAFILALQRDGRFIPDPRGETVLRPDDQLIVFGTRMQLDTLGEAL
jgi:voltage-gated potassium channel